MKPRTNLKFVLIFCIMILAILLVGTTKVEATDEEDLKFCFFTIHNKNDDSNFNMGQGDAEYEELGCELEDIKEGYYLQLNTQINLGDRVELKDLGTFYRYRTYNGTSSEDTSTYYEYKQIAHTSDIKSIADISKNEYKLEYDFKDIETNKTQHFTLDLFFSGDLTSIKKEKQELDKKLSNLNLPKNEKGYEIYKCFELGNVDESFNLSTYATETLTKAINDSSISIEWIGGMGGLTPFALEHPLSYFIFKDGVYYGRKLLGYGGTREQITVPSNVDDIEAYAISRLKSYIEKYNKEVGEVDGIVEFVRIAKVSGENYKLYWRYKGITNQEDSENNIVIKKATSDNTGSSSSTTTDPITKEDKTTGIKIEGSISVNITISSNKVTDQTVINKVAEVLKNISNKYVTYDISLLENGTKVQPNGKIKVSIPIPSGYDTSKLVVYRITDNGEKIEYKPTVSNNYAVFETDHFSTYVLAETGTVKAPSQDKTNTTTSNSNKLDDTPKTGINTITLIASAMVSIISLAGIIIIKKK